MFKEIIINKLKLEFKFMIDKYSNSYLSKLNDNDKKIIEEIIAKDNYTKNDINKLSRSYKDFSDDELMSLIISKKEKDKFLVSIIKYYLIDNEKIVNKIIDLENKGITSNDINILDNYLNNKTYTNNAEIFKILDKIKNNDLFFTNEELKNKKEKLINILNIFKNNLFDLDLINLFLEEKIEKYDNYYFQYTEFLNKLNNNIHNNNKNFILTCLTFMDEIDLFKNIKLNKEDLVNYISFLENKGIVFKKNNITKLFSNFRKKYNQDNNLDSIVNELINKVINEYSNFCEKKYYFKKEDFIEYYNFLFDDDFSCFYFDDKKRCLDNRIFDTIFTSTTFDNNIITLEEELKNFKSFKSMFIDYKINCLNDEKTYYERYQFYLDNIDKIIEFYQLSCDITIEYFILRNIKESDRREFFELFKCRYNNECKTIIRNSKTIKNSSICLMIDFINELNNAEFSKRYDVLYKYQGYLKIFDNANYNNAELLKIFRNFEENGFYNIPEIKQNKSKRKKRK